jgi:UDP-hydrolysing UDP-N-acetyl-D-glucosamine 2-epimerase
MNHRRRICVFTGTRADYGLLRSLMAEIKADPELQLQIVVGGMHLSTEFGLTYREIEADGFVIDAKVEMLISSDTAVGICKSMGLGIMGFGDALERLRPDIAVILGDRFEALAAAQAVLVVGIPLAHVHGGEITEGAIDESIRHAISKMAHWHFVAAEPYRQRVIQLGESPDAVFNVGAPGLDCLDGMEWLDRDQLAVELGTSLRELVLLVTYHPVTLGDGAPAQALGELLAGLDRFPQATVVFTYPNADAGGRELIPSIDEYVARNPERTKAFVSLGRRRYLNLLRISSAVVGNSSSGLTEAPALKVATVNIGDRQRGRLKAASVIDVAEERTAIALAISKALSREFQAKLAGTVSLYGHGNAGRQIKAQLKKQLPGCRKKFFDIRHGY